MEVDFFVNLLVAVIAYYFGKRSGSSKSSGLNIDVEHDYFEDKEDRAQDSWEGSFWEASDPKRLTTHLQIDYEDADQNLSTRSVQVREFDTDLSNGIIMGHCQLRKSTRTFRIDRIKKCINLMTGEAVHDLKQHLNDLYEKSPERSIEKMKKDFLDVLKVVYFVAKSDGQCRKEEIRIIASYFGKLLNDERVTFEMTDEVLGQIDVPSLQGFKLALGRALKLDDVDTELLASCCREIVSTQKSVHPMEKEALEYIDKKIKAVKRKSS